MSSEVWSIDIVDSAMVDVSSVGSADLEADARDPATAVADPTEETESVVDDLVMALEYCDSREPSELPLETRRPSFPETIGNGDRSMEVEDTGASGSSGWMIQRAISREMSTLKSVHMSCMHMSAATERTSSGDGKVRSHDACTTRA